MDKNEIIKITSGGASEGSRLFATTLMGVFAYCSSHEGDSLSEFIEYNYSQYKKLTRLANNNADGDVTFGDLCFISQTEEMIDELYKSWKQKN